MKMVLLIPIFLISAAFSASAAFALCVTADTANLRSGPGTNYDVSWQVFKYMPLKMASQKGDWYRVQDIDGETHWIYKPLVTDNISCAVVKVDEANIRSGPGEQYNKTSMSPLFMYESLKVIEKKGSWVKVMLENEETGWVLDNLLWIQ
ncbi:MAG: SH3 domain-containing protein [Nitrospirae bacterium]|nr:SH3 domain-containing protein [Nitrospirota bacterium]